MREQLLIVSLFSITHISFFLVISSIPYLMMGHVLKYCMDGVKRSFCSTYYPCPFTNLASTCFLSFLSRQIELKMLESAQNLIKVCQNETKLDKLAEALRTHRVNSDRLRQQLKEAKGGHGHLVLCVVVLTPLCTHTAQREVSSSLSLPPVPPSPPPPSTSPNEALLPEHQRSKIIEELLLTEKDFHHQMQLCCSKIMPALQEVRDVFPQLVCH